MKKGYNPKGKLGTGVRFAQVSGSSASEYIKKGYPAAQAEKIGAAIAAKAGRAKFGAKKMANISNKSK